MFSLPAWFSPHRPSKYATKFTWQKQILAFSLCFLMFFTSLPTELIGSGFFNDSRNFAGLEQAQARERTQRNRGGRQYAAISDEVASAQDTDSRFAGLNLAYLSADSNVYLDGETGEETEVFFTSPVRFFDEIGAPIEIDASLEPSDFEGFAYQLQST